MSGGHFDYQQLWLNDIANELEQLIMRAGREIPRKEIESEWYGYCQNCYDDCIVTKNYPDYDPQTIAIMKRAVYVMRLAYIYAQRIDWLLSGDDGEDDLQERLKEELAELRSKYPSGKFTFNRNKVQYDEDSSCWREISDNEDKNT